MFKTAAIPRNSISRIQLYINTGRKSLAAIKAETGASHILNGGLFDSKWKACCHLRSEGYTYAEDAYNYNGYGWDCADLRIMPSRDKESVRNYICCCELIRDGEPLSKPIYNSEQGGARGRSAIGLTVGGDILLYCSQDGSGDAMTPEQLRDKIYSLGAYSAVMLDCGGSSQCDFDGSVITSSRIVHNLILVYTKSTGTEGAKNMTVCLDPGHGGNETANGSPDGLYKEHEFSLDMGGRIKAHLVRHGVNVVMTREENKTVALAERAQIANNAKADLFVSLHSNAAGSSGWYDASGLCVYTSSAGEAERNKLANAILARAKECGAPVFSSGLYHSGFTVLVKTATPACLIEYAFHTSKTDVENLKSGAWRDKLAEATARGILDRLGVQWQEPAQTSGKVYRVQAGAFSVRDNAQVLADKLKAQGYSTIIKEE